MSSKKSFRYPPEKRAKLFEEILSRLAKGESLASIQRTLDVSMGTIRKWIADDKAKNREPEQLEMGDTSNKIELKDKIKELSRSGFKPRDIARQLGMSKTAIYGHLQRMRNEKPAKPKKVKEPTLVSVPFYEAAAQTNSSGDKSEIIREMLRFLNGN